MRDIAEEIDALRAQPGTASEIAALEAWYRAIGQSLGGDEPANTGAGGPVLAPQGGVARLAAPSCGTPTTTTNFAGVGGAITPPTPAPPFLGNTFTCDVTGVGPYLWDLDLGTTILHTDCSDLDIRLTSPAGTVVTITTDNGGVNDNVFNGTLWDESANEPCTDATYVNNVPETPLSTEGRLEAFRGEDPNGTWTLTIFDDLATDTGSLSAWSLDVTTLGGAPTETTASVSDLPAVPIAIPDAGNLLRPIGFVSADTFISKVTVFLEITHTDCSDLDITLTSPGGSTVKLTTDNGSTNDNVFNGTLFDGDAPTPVTDAVYANNVVVPLVSPEGAFEKFRGEDPNGTWILLVTDDVSSDTGALVRWDLNITTTTAPSPAAPVNFAGTTGSITDNPGTPPPTISPTQYTVLVSGAGASLWDVDLNTAISITSCADVDMTLTSPAGTVVTISTDNGGTFDDCFNGTRWDDNVTEMVTDRTYANAVVAVAISPEGRLDKFRGEDPNGVWTLTITDDALLDNGTLNSWSLDVTTLPSAPGEVSTTFTSSPGIVFTTGSPPQIFSNVIPVAGLGTNITEIEVFLELPHEYGADLDITLRSPAGTTVTLTTDNGIGIEQCYNGTLFDADAPLALPDYPFVIFVLIPTVQSEGAFAAFQGKDPNGDWTMTVSDDAGVDGGTWVRWDLIVRTCSPAPFNAFCFGDGIDPLVTNGCPCANNGGPGRGCASSFNVLGAQLSATGSPALDNVVLTASGVNATGNAIFMRGSADNVVGTVFGDGVRCVDGTLIRRTKPIFAPNTASFPAPADTVLLSTGWGAANTTPPGSAITAYSMAYYRNAAGIFCPPETFNGTNAFVITW